MPTGGDKDIPEYDPLFNVIRSFLACPDRDSAAQYADAHPELRTPLVIHLLMTEKNDESVDEARAQRLQAAAALLCGASWPTGPAVIETISEIVTALESPTLDDVALERLSEHARDLVEDISTARPHPVIRPMLLDDISAILDHLHGVTGEGALLDEAVQVQREAVAAAPSGGADRSGLLNNLAVRLGDLYSVTGEGALLDEAVQVQREAVAAAPSGGADRSGLLNNLAVRLAYLFRLTGNRALLDEAVESAREAVATTPPDSAGRPARLYNLAVPLGDLYSVTGDRVLLDEAVETAREAVATTPPGSADRHRHLNYLAVRLGDLYSVTGDGALLDETVQVQREAVATTPSGSADRPGLLNNLAVRLGVLYEVTGDRVLLDEAVETAREAVATAPPGSADRPGFLTNLAIRLGDLYAANGDRALLDEAVQAQREAVASGPPSNTNWPTYLANLANLLGDLYAANGDRALLDEAVQAQREAIAATPLGSTSRPGYLNNLAVRLGDLYSVTGDRVLLDEAVETAREAVTITPPGSTSRPGYLNNLAIRLGVVYEVAGDRALLDEAVQALREAIAATPLGSTSRPGYLNNLAIHLVLLYNATGQRDLLDEAMSRVEGQVGGGPWVRSLLSRAKAQIVLVDEQRDDRFHVASEELTIALGAFRDVARPGLAPRERRDLAQRVDGLLGDLTITHVQAGMINRAVEFIEGDRMWLRAPALLEPGRSEPPVAVAWVMAGQWGSVVVTTVDHRDAEQRRSHILEPTAAGITGRVISAVDAVRSQPDGSPGSGNVVARARQEAVAQLCRLTSEIAVVFPPVERLLIVPLGICALLPYTAATRPDGAFLIDHTSITIAPSLAWARASRRARPTGPSIGVFHPGRRPGHQLDLEEDRQTFAELLGQPIPGLPTADQVLSLIGADTDIGHFSCHGSYNSDTPWDSALELETDLTIQAVLDHSTAPWLVNLSACETAIPDLQATEQHISFPTGFLRGGAAHVLATLWPVDNNYATAVNREFYRQLATKRHPADALRQAIHHTRGTTQQTPQAHAHRRPMAATDQSIPLPIDDPYWWAPFTHHGSPW